MIAWCQNCETEEVQLWDRELQTISYRPWCQQCLADNDKRSTLIEARRAEQFEYEVNWCSPDCFCRTNIIRSEN